MPLEQNFVYTPWEGIKFIQDGEEGRILGLLKDVRANLSILKPNFSNQNLKEILVLVEGKELILQARPNEKEPHAEINYRIDLSNAKQRIDQYRRDSEGGCQSCKRLRHFMPLQDEHVYFCNKYENNDVTDSGHSPRLERFYKTGCDEKEFIIGRKLEEVLKDFKE